MTGHQAPPATKPAGGAYLLRATIIANLCADEGCCIMCADCGHVFVDSNPLSDESVEIDNVTLAKALYYHMCAIGRRQPKRVVTYGGKSQRRR